jgi:hypothetical protein
MEHLALCEALRCVSYGVLTANSTASGRSNAKRLDG